MAEHIHKPIGSLSGGQQQPRVHCPGLAGQPGTAAPGRTNGGYGPGKPGPLLFPLKDPIVRKGLTLMLASHDLEAISTIVDRQVCLDRYLCSCCCNLSDSPQGATCRKKDSGALDLREGKALEIFQYGYMNRAILMGIVVGITCPVIGLFIVLRRMSLIADALSTSRWLEWLQAF